MASIVRMAKWLDIVVVAEGVDTQAQVEFLRSVGCDEVQGYFFAKPMPSSEFTALLKNPDSMRKPHERDRERLLSDFNVQALWESNQQTTLLFSGMIGAAALFELTGDTLEVLRVNEGYFELMGSTPQSLLNRRGNSLERLEPIDRQKLLNACNRAKLTHTIEQTQICYPHADGRIIWLDVKIRHLGSVNKQDLFYFAMGDITHQKDLERNILLYQYGAAMLDAYNEVLELNYTDSIATSFSFSGSGNYHTVTLPLDSVLRASPEKRIHPDDHARYHEIVNREYLENAFSQKKRRAL